MAPAALVGILTTGGYGIRLEGERLIVHPSDTMTDPLRNLIRDNKPALVRYLRQMQAPANDPDQGIPSRLWLIRHADGALVSHSFTPPASREEVAGWYPEALAIEPEEA
jgi:hypothetical protein